ncbi:AzlC family ABC transporter permease [Pseudoscardovia radai]|uniref:AzlC family ABC transporter permease n=1 Tax=Pseudoscardovia radai TaxID=987066 RepID=UPI00399144C6
MTSHDSGTPAAQQPPASPSPDTGSHTRTAHTRALGAAFPRTLPVLAGYIFLGITYGLLMVSNGFPVWLPVLTAGLIYTGSLEFLMVQILTSAFNPLSAFVTALMVGSRHIFYGIAMLGRYRDTGRRKPYLIFATTDETFAVNYSADIPAGVDAARFYTAVSALDQTYWMAGSLLGAMFGSLLTVNTTGLDFVMTTMFMAILLNQWLADSAAARRAGIYGFLRSHISEIVGVVCSLACLLVFGPDQFIVPSLALILVVLTVFRRRIAPTLPSDAVAVGDGVKDGSEDGEDDGKEMTR